MSFQSLPKDLVKHISSFLDPLGVMSLRDTCNQTSSDIDKPIMDGEYEAKLYRFPSYSIMKSFYKTPYGEQVRRYRKSEKYYDHGTDTVIDTKRLHAYTYILLTEYYGYPLDRKSTTQMEISVYK